MLVAFVRAGRGDLGAGCAGERDARQRRASIRNDEVGRHYNLANEVAKRRAARYLAEVASYF